MRRARRRRASVRLGQLATDHECATRRRHAELLKKRATVGLTADAQTEYNALGAESLQLRMQRLGKELTRAEHAAARRVPKATPPNGSAAATA